MTDVGRAILRTVAYFDLFSVPLSTLEVQRFLQEKTDLDTVVRELSNASLHDRLATRDGFWFLRGREEIVAERLRRARIAERKFARARAVSRLIAGIKGVQLIAVANTLAYSASRDESDIDLFIVTKPGALWRVRAVAVGALDIFGLRPSDGKERDALCLSFFVSEDALDLHPIAFSEDPYLAYWVASLVPIYDAGGVYGAFMKANEWIREMLPNAWSREVTLRTVRPLVPIPTLPGTFARKYQWRRFPPLIRDMMNRDSRVVVNDHMLKFHTNDRREEFRDRWQEKCRQLGV